MVEYSALTVLKAMMADIIYKKETLHNKGTRSKIFETHISEFNLLLSELKNIFLRYKFNDQHPISNNLIIEIYNIKQMVGRDEPSIFYRNAIYDLENNFWKRLYVGDRSLYDIVNNELNSFIES